MDAPLPNSVVAAFAAAVRHGLVTIGNTVSTVGAVGSAVGGAVGSVVAPLRPRRESADLERAGTAEDRRGAMVIVGAAAPFATTPQARARLLRQAHASGLLTARDTEHALRALEA
ncbi:MAG: hypothetical protein QOE97_2360 [Pseudonocardiales bacterium]|jgi:hypothetical protein|nr:hypothetical protein [Pseudonocardiales bacterium]